MKAVLVFIDGTICDTRHRNHLYGSEQFYHKTQILKDTPVPGSIQCLQELSRDYRMIYLGARRDAALEATKEWLVLHGFPEGEVFLSEEQAERLRMVRELCKKHDFAAGIGDRWDDNELHLEMGCISIILEEYRGHWDTVRRYLPVRRAGGDPSGKIQPETGANTTAGEHGHNGEIGITLCTEHDLGILAELNKELIEDEQHDNKMDTGQLKERMHGFLRSGYEAYLFKAQEHIVGYALVNLHREPLYLRHFYICRDFRRKGFGRVAFKRLLETLHAETMDIEVLVRNERGKSFWKALGFEERSVYMRYRQ